MKNNNIFNELFEVIDNRKQKSPDESYVSSLMHKGLEKINSKIIEEANEVCEAAYEEDKEHIIYEICDLLFHTFVLAGFKNITLDDISEELQRRFEFSGLEEKKRRNK